MKLDSKIILTWDRPTWKLHIWHFFWSLKERLKLQNELKKWDEMYILIADMQALTDRKDKEQIKKIKENIYELMTDYLLIWLDYTKVNFVLQSQVPEISHIFYIFSCFTPRNYIDVHIPQVKQEAKLKWNKNISLWFYLHPIHQAADILSISEAWKTIYVPVWKDQSWNLNYAKYISKRINNISSQLWNWKILSEVKEIFWVSENIKWLDWKKMSKSLWNVIYLRDSNKDIEYKIMKLMPIWYDYNQKKPLNIELFNQYTELFFDKEEAEFYKKEYLEFNKLHIKTFKKKLIENIINFLEEIKINKKILNMKEEDKRRFIDLLIKFWTEKYKNKAIKTLERLRKIFSI